MMKLSLLAALAMVMSAAAAPSPVERKSADPSPQIYSTPFEYPATAGGSSRFKRSAGVESNAERFQRGLTPSRPRQLYGANKGLAKRVLGAAPSTNPMDTPRYRLIGCSSAYGGGAGTATFVIPYATIEELADGCAVKQRQLAASGNVYQPSFVITTAPSGLYNSGNNCQISVIMSGSEQCTDANAAFYTPA